MSLRFPGTFSWGGACNGQMLFSSRVSSARLVFLRLWKGWARGRLGDWCGGGNDAGWGAGYRGSAEDHFFVPGGEVLWGLCGHSSQGGSVCLATSEAVENPLDTYTGSLLCSCNTFFWLWCFYGNHKNILLKIQSRSKLIYLYFLPGLGLAGPRWSAA